MRATMHACMHARVSVLACPTARTLPPSLDSLLSPQHCTRAARRLLEPAHVHRCLPSLRHAPAGIRRIYPGSTKQGWMTAALKSDYPKLLEVKIPLYL